MAISFSFFNHYKYIAPQRMDCTWSELVEILHEFSTHPTPASLAAKNQHPAISPAIYAPNTHRKNENVQAWGGFFALDIDGGMQPDDARALLHRLDVNHIVYSSTRSTVEHPKFRILIEADQHIPASSIPKAWAGLATLIPDLDQACKDRSRLYFMPALWMSHADNPAPYVFFHAETSLRRLSVASMLDRAPPAPSELPRRQYHRIFAQGPLKPLHDVRAVLTDVALERYCSLPAGEHHRGLYSLMCSTAAVAKLKGYNVSPADIVEAARLADRACPIKTNATRWRTIAAEANRAMRSVGL